MLRLGLTTNQVVLKTQSVLLVTWFSSYAGVYDMLFRAISHELIMLALLTT